MESVGTVTNRRSRGERQPYYGTPTSVRGTQETVSQDVGCIVQMHLSPIIALSNRPVAAFALAVIDRSCPCVGC